MSRRYRMPSLDRAVYVAGVLRRIRIEAVEEMRSCQPYLVVHDASDAVDEAVLRIEPQAAIEDTRSDRLAHRDRLRDSLERVLSEDAELLRRLRDN